MKALSLYQPYASLVPGPKGLETRSWNTSYRGPLLICAAKVRLPYEILVELGKQPEFREALAPLIGITRDAFDWAQWVRNYLPYGKAVAACILVATYSTGAMTREQIGESYPFGDFSPKRFAWDLRDRKAIKEPFPVVGRQRLFEVDDCLLEGKELVKWAA